MESHHISLTDTARPMIFNNIQKCQWAHAHRPEMVCTSDLGVSAEEHLGIARPLACAGLSICPPTEKCGKPEELCDPSKPSFGSSTLRASPISIPCRASWTQRSATGRATS